MTAAAQIPHGSARRSSLEVTSQGLGVNTGIYILSGNGIYAAILTVHNVSPYFAY